MASLTNSAHYAAQQLLTARIEAQQQLSAYKAHLQNDPTDLRCLCLFLDTVVANSHEFGQQGPLVAISAQTSVEILACGDKSLAQTLFNQLIDDCLRVIEASPSPLSGIDACEQILRYLGYRARYFTEHYLKKFVAEDTSPELKKQYASILAELSHYIPFMPTFPQDANPELAPPQAACAQIAQDYFILDPTAKELVALKSSMPELFSHVEEIVAQYQEAVAKLNEALTIEDQLPQNLALLANNIPADIFLDYDLYTLLSTLDPDNVLQFFATTQLLRGVYSTAQVSLKCLLHCFPFILSAHLTIITSPLNACSHRPDICPVMTETNEEKLNQMVEQVTRWINTLRPALAFLECDAPLVQEESEAPQVIAGQFTRCYETLNTAVTSGQLSKELLSSAADELRGIVEGFIEPINAPQTSQADAELYATTIHVANELAQLTESPEANTPELLLRTSAPIITTLQQLCSYVHIVWMPQQHAAESSRPHTEVESVLFQLSALRV